MSNVTHNIQRNRKPWTQDEDDYLRKVYMSGKCTSDYTAVFLHRTQKAITERARILRLSDDLKEKAVNAANAETNDVPPEGNAIETVAESTLSAQNGAETDDKGEGGINTLPTGNAQEDGLKRAVSRAKLTVYAPTEIALLLMELCRLCGFDATMKLR